MRPRWTVRKCWLGLACSGIFLFLVVRDVDWGRTAATVRQADWSLVGLGVGTSLATLVTLACRWRVLLSSMAALPVQETFSGSATRLRPLLSNHKRSMVQ